MLVVQVLPAQPCLEGIKRNNAMKFSVKTSHWNTARFLGIISSNCCLVLAGRLLK